MTFTLKNLNPSQNSNEKHSAIKTSHPSKETDKSYYMYLIMNTEVEEKCHLVTTYTSTQTNPNQPRYKEKIQIYQIIMHIITECVTNTTNL